MGSVVSLGSVNRDSVAYVDREEIDDLSTRYAWFPSPGETRKIEDIPDEFARRKWQAFTGGKGANQAVAARHAGSDTAFLGKVGDDDVGADVLSTLRRADVNVNHVVRVNVPTGRAFVFVDGAGENYIVIVAGANGTVDVEYVGPLYDRILEADSLLLQNEIPMPPMEWLLDRLAAEDDRPTVIVNPAPATNAYRLLSYDSVDYVTPNEAEYAALRPHLDRFEGVLIRTRGDEEVLVETPKPFSVVPPSVEVVDSTGAGDVFNGYLAARIAEGDLLEEAVETATVAASLSTRVEGAQEAIPGIDEVESFRS